MTISDLSNLSEKEIKKLKFGNTTAFFIFMLASMGFLLRAFIQADTIILLLAIGVAFSARGFYANTKALKALQHQRLNR